MSFILRLLGQKVAESDDPSYSESLNKIEQALAGLPEQQAKYLSAFALLLGRVAYSDLQFSDKEVSKIKEILANQSQLNSAQIDLICSIVIERLLYEHVDHHIVLRQINELTDKTKKEEIIRVLFHLAKEDDISEEESNEIRKISTALGFSHKEYIEMRSEFRDYLSILK